MSSLSTTASRLFGKLFLLLTLLASTELQAARGLHPAETCWRQSQHLSPGPHVLTPTVGLAQRAGEMDEPPETGDLEGLRRFGRIRVLLPERHDVQFPDRSLDGEEMLLEGLSVALGLPIERVPVKGREELAQRLMAGRGDVIVGVAPFGHRRTPPPGVAATLPLGEDQVWVVARRDGAMSRLAGLESAFGRTLTLPADSPLWPDVPRLERRYPWVRFEAATFNLDRHGLAQALVLGRVDAVALPSTEAQRLAAESTELAVTFPVGEAIPAAWYVRSSAPELLAAVNAYLEQHQVAYRPSEIYRADLPELRQRGVLRAIIRQDGGEFIVAKGVPQGFGFEVLQRLAERFKLRLETRVASSEAESLRWLAEGRGDLVASPVGLTDDGVRRTLPYYYAAPVVITPTWAGITAPQDLAGLRCLLPPGSPHRAVVETLSRQGVAVEIVESREYEHPRALMKALLDDDRSFTVVDGDKVTSTLAGHPDLRAALSLLDGSRFRWTVRASDQALATAADDFIRGYWGHDEHATLAARFRKSERNTTPGIDLTRLSPFDELVQRSAGAHGFDWRLIVSIMYQESHFDPQARSPHGAMGLMQVLPSTARSLGIRNLLEPGSAILAGVRYLEDLRDRFESGIAVKDRTWFAIAAYHAGPSRVDRARELAAEMHLDPDRWFGHVEKAMESLARSGGRPGSRSGVYRTTVEYVREVRTRFDTYVQVAAPQFAESAHRERGARL